MDQSRPVCRPCHYRGYRQAPRDRDHGAYTTIVEEVLRAAYSDKVGATIWRAIKRNTETAFRTEPRYVGTALLNELRSLAQADTAFSRFSLVGHSTGAIYINDFIGAAAARLPNARFDVVFVAPACRFEHFNNVLEKHSTAIANFRMFAMDDERESSNRLASIIYPRSLLYFISGVLEREADAPIMGMQRFFTNSKLFGGRTFQPSPRCAPGF